MKRRTLPAEWAPHYGTQLTWPTSPAMWGEAWVPVQRTFAQIASLLSAGEVVHVVVANLNTQNTAAELVRQAGGDPEVLRWHVHPSDDVWARDHGPMIIVEHAGEPDQDPKSGQPTGRPSADLHEVGTPALVDWRFDAWGGKYPSERDNALPSLLNGHWQLPRYVPGWTLEGGAVESNGAGDLLVTRSVLLDTRRNADASRDVAAAQLHRWLGAERIHWLDGTLTGDDTDGHIDTLARFVGPQTIVAPRAPHGHLDASVLSRNLATLSACVGSSGDPFEIVELPTPNPVVVRGEVLPATYANFAVGDAAVLVPAFDQPATDREACAILQRLLQRPAISVDSRALITQYGGLHCVTRDLPFALGTWLARQALSAAT